MGKQSDTAYGVGDLFEHASQLDPSWIPSGGQRYRDAPHVVMEISRVEHGRQVWYRPRGSRGPGFVASADAMTEGGQIVRRWVGHRGGTP